MDILDKNGKEVQYQLNEVSFLFKVSIQEIRPNRLFKEDSDEEK